MNFGEQLAQNFKMFVTGLSVFLVGITMVFMALAILIMLITVVGKVVTHLENKKEVPQVSTPVPVAPVKEPEVVSTVDELELVAVITAAIAASMGTTTDKLRVRSLRQVTRQK